jgi:cytochrome c553
MNRLCALLLLLLLPIQLSWATAGAYCAHDPSESTAHFGHHVHVHQSQADNDGSSPLKFHPDCSSCHAVTFSPSQVDDTLAVPDATAMPPSPLVLSIGSAPQSEPERPKWATHV